ncbi:unnamed protein product [Litomosoides sigmodontis]|uniref:Shugoshin C-terminal domain-containing protein n=1 Tax=Litomosoides sigmodontis TaxID=42156 RepID=A0A3P6ULB8_LITSI|nr:unnamed protein product [Litomosoides sigmodontis]
MTTTSTDGSNRSLFETFSSKLNTVRSNRSLVAANQQLHIELSFAKAEINRLQNEIVNLQERIAGLESTSDEERVEMIVRKRLQQRVQHLKSITNRTVQYLEKTKADFDHAADRLDHILLSNNFDDGTTYAGEHSRNSTARVTGNEIIGCRTKRQPTLEAVEEDVYGEMDGNEDIISDRDLIIRRSGNKFKQSLDSRTSSRNSRRETFFVRKELYEFDNGTETSFVEVSSPETNQTVSCLSTHNHEDPSSVAVQSESKTPATISVPEVPNVSSKLEIPISNCKSRSCKLKTSHDENTPTKSNLFGKSEVVTQNRKKRKISINQTPKRCKKSLENNAETTIKMDKLLIMPTSTSPASILSEADLNGGVRCKRAAAAKIPSFKEPNLVTKMRNPNVN